jgi:hypothetical protein
MKPTHSQLQAMRLRSQMMSWGEVGAAMGVSKRAARSLGQAAAWILNGTQGETEDHKLAREMANVARVREEMETTK